MKVYEIEPLMSEWTSVLVTFVPTVLGLALFFFNPFIGTAQNFPDRIVLMDPLAVQIDDTTGFIWMPSTKLYAEFGRYSDGSGLNHQWNARLGGFVEFARWDSTWSIAAMGTMEVIMDPLNNIKFNPRAIFWEEGAIASARLTPSGVLQFGYMHRCKHDIDNLEIERERGITAQRTVIYSSILTRYLWRPQVLIDGNIQLSGSFAVRNDFFTHLLDDYNGTDSTEPGINYDWLADAVTLTGRLDIRPRDVNVGLHLNGSFMLALYGEDEGFSGRFSNVTALGSLPFLELGLDFFNPRGGSFTLFARGEWQKDGAIAPVPTPAKLFLFGVRTSDFQSMW